MTNSELIQRLQESPARLVAEIAASAGIPEGTLRKIYYGETTNPRIDTVDALRAYFQREKARAQ